MKHTLICLAFVGLMSCLWAQDKQLSALFNYNAFYLPEAQKSYVETYLSFDAWSLQFQPTADGKYKATVEVILQAKQGDSTVYIKKYDLSSPATADTTLLDWSFVDLQRFYLPNGIYTIDLSVRDKGSQAQASVVQQRIGVAFEHKKASMSNLQLMASVKKTTTQNLFSRSGYDMEPYLSDFIPEEITKLNLYYEVYNLQREVGKNPFVSLVFIEDQATGRRVGDIQQAARHQTSQLVPIFSQIDIQQLPSGRYNLVVELHNKAGENMLYKKLPFVRSNPTVSIAASVAPSDGSFAADITDENKLNYYLDALYPIASEAEKNAIKDMISRPALTEKQMFFYNFWLQRDAIDPKGKWIQYRGWLEYVDQAFAYPRTPGYRTDRGRVYLQYGPPDFIRDEKNFVGVLKLGYGTDFDEKLGGRVAPSQGSVHYLPYQLWRYNKLETDDANRVFLFWDEFRSGFYKLLVSNARGETLDPLWERRLSQQQLEEYVVGEVGEQFNRGY
ncbi:MAG: GWxTD domain-containing protein [Bacteroidales bacterium]|nr:GWxTD domain-containing protein [Candidatus Colimorpha onthohippi]